MDKIRFHKTLLDQNGRHAEYSVYKKGDKFIFECLEWAAPNGSNVTAFSIKQHTESDIEEKVIKDYKHYISVWEGEAAK